VRGVRAQRCADQLGELTALYRQGALRVLIRAGFSLAQNAAARREVERGHGRGEVVVVVHD